MHNAPHNKQDVTNRIVTKTRMWATERADGNYGVMMFVGSPAELVVSDESFSRGEVIKLFAIYGQPGAGLRVKRWNGEVERYEHVGNHPAVGQTLTMEVPV
jgi:hypothetical protein